MEVGMAVVIENGGHEPVIRQGMFGSGERVI